MKKTFLSFIFSALALVSANADKYMGLRVTNGKQKTYYLFTEKPKVRWTQEGKVTVVSLYLNESSTPVLTLPLTDGDAMTFKFDTWTSVNLNDAGYATFSSSYDVVIDNMDVAAYKATVAGEKIILTELDGKIPAGNGVLLYSETSGEKVYMSLAKSGTTADMTGNSLKATTHSDGSLADLEANSWVLGSENLFLKYTGNAYIHNRAYLIHEQSAGAKLMTMVFAADEPTGIDKPSVAKASAGSGKFLENGSIIIMKNGVKYNLAGQVVK